MIKFCIGCEFKHGNTCKNPDPNPSNCIIYQTIQAIETGDEDSFSKVFNMYKRDVNRTAPINNNGPEFLIEMGLGMSKEVGEMAGIIDKAYCQGHPFNREKFIEEAGDFLFYFVAALNRLRVSFIEIIKVNIQKRLKRFPHGFTVKDSIERRDQKK